MFYVVLRNLLDRRYPCNRFQCSIPLRTTSWLQELWTVFVPDLSASCSVQTTLSSAKLEQETTGLKVTTLRELSWSTPCLMSFARRPKVVIAFRDFSFAIPLVEALVQAWEHSWFPRCEKSTQTVSWKHSPWFLHQRCRTRWWSHTTHLWFCLGEAVTWYVTCFVCLCVLTSLQGRSNSNPHNFYEINTCIHARYVQKCAKMQQGSAEKPCWRYFGFQPCASC